MVTAISGLILTFIGTIVTNIGLVPERESGTLEQLTVLPIKPSTVILGKISPYFLVAAIDMTIITVLGRLLLRVPFNDNLLCSLSGLPCSCSWCSTWGSSSRLCRRPQARRSRPRSCSRCRRSCCRG